MFFGYISVSFYIHPNQFTSSFLAICILRAFKLFNLVARLLSHVFYDYKMNLLAYRNITARDDQTLPSKISAKNHFQNITKNTPSAKRLQRCERQITCIRNDCFKRLFAFKDLFQVVQSKTHLNSRNMKHFPVCAETSHHPIRNE